MNTIHDIFMEFGPEYLARFGESIPQNHRKVMDAIINCRTPACGMVVYDCIECGEIHHAFRSCGNRHCPNCQHQKTMDWLNRQVDRQLPGHHFFITFTVPEQLRFFMRSHQSVSYDALFRSSSDALKKLTPDEKYMGADLPGFFGVLHTWGRQMQYHPHIHYLAVGGAFSKKDGKWHPTTEDFYLPVRALSRIIRAKFRDLMTDAGLYDRISSEVWKIDWNVHIQPVKTAEQTIRYLAPYVFKVAISDHRIEKVDGRIVTIRYKKSGSSRTRRLNLDAMEFIRRFLQHVLPTGFKKVRYYGLMNPNASVSPDHIRGLIELDREFEIETPEPEIRKPASLNCPSCGGELKYRCSILPFQTPPWTRIDEPVFRMNAPDSG
jgi:hypothetical protein